MKYLKHLLLTLALMSVVLAQPAGSIIGDWVQQSQDARWTFRSDGTGFMERGTPKITARFEWKLKGNTLEVTTQAGTSVSYQIVENNGNLLVIKNQMVAQVYQLQRQ